MKTIFSKSVNTILVYSSLLSGVIISLLIKDGFTSLLLNGKNFDNRSLFTQMCILVFLVLLTSAILLLLFSALNLLYGGNEKLQQLVKKIFHFTGVSNELPISIELVISKKLAIKWSLVIVMILLNFLLSSHYYHPGDLDAFLSSGRAVINGTNPYTGWTQHYGLLPNRNPPISLLAFMPLSNFTVEQVYPIMYAVSAVMSIASVIMLYLWYRPNIPFLHASVIFASSGLWSIFSVGQIYIFLLLDIVIAWILIHKKNYLLAGLFIGFLISIKPNFILWPFLLFLAGFRKVSISAIISAIFFTLIPAPFLGLSVYFEWLKLSSTAFAENGMYSPENASAFGFADRLGAIGIGYVIVAFILCLTIFWIFKTRPDIELVGRAAIVISVLASPLGWNMYSALMLPIFFIPKWNKPIVLASILFMIPSPTLHELSDLSPISLILTGSFYFMGLMLILISSLAQTDENLRNIHFNSGKYQLSN